MKGLWLSLIFLSLRANAATLPVAASDVAASWDQVYWFLIWLSLFFFVGIVGAMVIFALKYRKSVAKKPKYITDHTGIEIAWTVIPTILVLIVFWWGWVVYKDMVRPPSDAMEVRVIGKQWLWQFIYPHGATTINDLYVPVEQPVKLVMSSEDVLHSFFIPNFRVKSDVVPGMYTKVWFEAKVPGIHQVYCTEYCGTSHSAMLARLIVLSRQEYREWVGGKKIDIDALPGDPSFPGYRANFLGQESKNSDSKKSASELTLAEKGKAVVEKNGCVACHSATGVAGVGPSYKGIYGQKAEFVDGTSVTRDDAYIKESIEKPLKNVVKGFAPAMPVYAGVISAEEIVYITEYIKSLK